MRPVPYLFCPDRAAAHAAMRMLYALGYRWDNDPTAEAAITYYDGYWTECGLMSKLRHVAIMEHVANQFTFRPDSEIKDYLIYGAATLVNSARHLVAYARASNPSSPS